MTEMTREIKRAVRLLPILLCLWLVACSSSGPANSHQGSSTGTSLPPKGASSATFTLGSADFCPKQLDLSNFCMTPHALRLAYGMEPLIERGLDGRGQTIVDIVSYGDPTLQQDLKVFDQEFHLPPVSVQQLAPLGVAPYNPNNIDMSGWADETALDVEVMHALAPGAHIIVLTSPVDETEGIVGLPQFLQLEQYAVNHHLGQIFCESFVATEVTFPDAQSRQFLQNFASFVQQATTKQGWTFFAASGDHGATDYNSVQSITVSPTRTVNFAPDMPWVVAVGGTTLMRNSTNNGFVESAWSGSGGGFSKFFGEPTYQKSLPQALQKKFNGQRGLPDVAADADPTTGMAIYSLGQWEMGGGTSASQPLWTALMAVADQMAGRPLGFINPALYKIGTSARAKMDFRDITVGNNTYSGGNVTVQGYSAAPGWDPVTGFGAPIANQLLPDLIAATRG
jgi:subtilase family serine protease